MHFEKFNFFSGLRSPELQLRYVHVHQHSNALTSSIYIFQSTTNAVYEVNNQMTANTNLENEPFGFQK